MKIGFTGTQKGMSEYQKRIVSEMLMNLSIKTDLECHHGDCIGADEQFHSIIPMGSKIVIHPPDNNSKRAHCNRVFSEIKPEKPYLKRNKDIVSESELLIATPNTKQEQLRSGTWSTIREAKRQNKQVIIVYP
jgi:predicted Rossmann fold nucleotide-binding protein DprA/Smf involved in DNA uptake